MSTVGIVRMYVIGMGLMVTGGYGMMLSLGYSPAKATVACIGFSLFAGGTIPDKWSRKQPSDQEAGGK